MYGGPLTIDLSGGAGKEYKFPRCNRLWLPKKFCNGIGAIATNPTDAVLGIQIGSQSAQMHPWSIADGFVTSVSGDMDTIYVTVLTKGASASISLLTGTDIGVGYGDTDGLSPTVYNGDGAIVPQARSGGSFGGSA